MRELIPVFEDRSHRVVNRILSEALRCPFCSASPGTLVAMGEARVVGARYLIACVKCGYKGPFGRGLEDAVKRWNRKPPFRLQDWLHELFPQKSRRAQRWGIRL